MIASAISMNLLLFGVAGPISGYLIDRFGPRKVMLGSLTLLITGVSGTVVMDKFWQFFLVWGVIVGLGAGGVGSVLTATVGNRWFVARRGLALGILGQRQFDRAVDLLAVLYVDDRHFWLAHRLDHSDYFRDHVAAAAVSFHARRSSGSRFGTLRCRPSQRHQRHCIAARYVLQKCYDYGARSGHSPDVLAFVRHFFCLRRHGQRTDRHAFDPARNRDRYPAGRRRFTGRYHGYGEHRRHDVFGLDGRQGCAAKMAGAGVRARVACRF